MKKFTYTEITHFDNCNGCPLKKFVDDDNSPIHTECTYSSNDWIEAYTNDGDEDYRNSDGVLDTCPFLKNNHITEEE